MNADLWTELGELTQKLDESIRDMRKTGQELAKAERAYKVELRKTSLALKMNGLAVGMIQLIAKGEPKVAELREKRDIAETFYQASKEAVMSYKLQIRIVDAQLSREWSSPQSRM